MCQIQIIQKLGKEKINKADIGEFFKMMCFGSMENNDAFGVFNHEYMFKKKGAFDASKLDEYSLTRNNFIIGHNRFTTSGYDIDFDDGAFPPKLFKSKSTSKMSPATWNWSLSFPDNMSNIFLPTYGWGKMNLDCEENKTQVKKKISTKKKSKKIVTYKGNDKNRNHHPFKLGDFTLIHNGTISNANKLQSKYNFHTTISTDSYVILELIDYFFKKSKIKNRIKRVASAIQKTCSELKGGYSVLLYDKKGKNTFYFKSTFTSFSLCKYGDKILCGSTSYENLDYLYFGIKKKIYNIKNKRVYLITSDIVSPVTDITPSPIGSKISWNNILDNEDWGNMDSKVENFLKDNLGFIPYHKITFMGNLKISRNDTHGIRKKIHKIVKDPKVRLGWYIIKSSDVNPMLNKKLKLKLNKVKGGKK